MTLKELAIGETFRRTPKGIVWKKLNEQGMNNCSSSIKTVEKYNTRCHRMSYKETVVDQTIEIYPVN